MIQFRQQVEQPIQAEIDQPRMQSMQSRDDALDAAFRNRGMADRQLPPALP